MNVFELDNDTAEIAYPAMKELRPHLRSREEFVVRFREQRTQGCAATTVRS